MKKVRINLVWLLGIFLLTPGVSLAGWYVGVGAGQTNMEAENSFDTGALESYSDSDSSSKVFGGFTFSNNFAVEFGYADLGEFTADIPADPLDDSFPEISAIDFLYQCIIHHNLWIL